MPVWEADSTSIMPLKETRKEIDDTYSLLKQLDLTWFNLFSQCCIETDKLTRIILVGSGDSWAVALVAAAWIESNSKLHCVARQTFEFLNSDLQRYDKETLIVIISASGRPSPATDALKLAVSTHAQVLGITNDSGSPFSVLASNMLFSGAQKKGMPTQSTSATLYLLLRLADLINDDSPKLDYVSDLLAREFSQMKLSWHQKERRAFHGNRVTFLGNHHTWGLAIIGSNLLSCGPQIHADAFLVEEFHHSLRLNQVSVGEHFILLLGSHAEEAFFHQTCAELKEKGASVDLIPIKPGVSQIYYFLCTLQYFYEMSWQLAVDFIEKGGRRVCHLETSK